MTISATYRLPSGTMLTIRIPAGEDVLREAARVLTPGGGGIGEGRFQPCIT